MRKAYTGNWAVLTVVFLLFFCCAATVDHPLRLQGSALVRDDVSAQTYEVATAGNTVLMPTSALQDMGSSPNAVGVILPLTGKWESIGQKVLRGIEAAGGVFSSGPASDITFIIRDYGSTEDAIPRIIDDLDRSHHVSAIIGPIGEKAGEIACREAQVRNLPFIILTQAETPPREGTFCFSNFLTIEHQARALLHTARSMGITRFAVMSPEDHFGRTFTEKFQRLAPGYGIEVVKTVTYPVQSVDFKLQLRSLQSGTQKAKGQTKAIEAILIPDSAEKASVIASYVSYLNMKNIRLFGPTLWDSPDLIRVGGRHMEDAVFLSGFFPGSILTAVQDFSRSFSQTFTYQPTAWEASAYDAASILLKLLQPDHPRRIGLRDSLARLKNYTGASGTISFSSDGRLEKSVHVLTVKGGVVYEIHP